MWKGVGDGEIKRKEPTIVEGEGERRWLPVAFWVGVGLGLALMGSLLRFGLGL
ncbi:hypothetical protein SLEP1_g58292 [Rubroshorea leprosula]|uniref:Uncharacterized protein n=1 Tax=Rubroshorea leprosula TaxID=152421 RepID=A0AAV5MRA1_9ROSI|nr:hypothetical protein SLEP1_g48261 [Rubroshorea leprosula]GKV51659.1 hypothetical protein SLEP1_g58292 [Rubroshorea leprosula]